MVCVEYMDKLVHNLNRAPMEPDIEPFPRRETKPMQERISLIFLHNSARKLDTKLPCHMEGLLLSIPMAPITISMGREDCAV